MTKHVDNIRIIDMKSNYQDVIPDEWLDMSKVFTALGDTHRQRILLLFEAGEELCAGEIADASTLSRSTVSHHLKILRDAKALQSRKAGKEVWFRINKPYLEEVLGNVLTYIRLNT